jgi:hypothetical protein
VKRFLLAALLVLLLAAAVGHLLRDRIAAAVVARVLPVLTARAAAHGLECRDLRYARVSMEGLAGTVVVHQPACRLHVSPGLVSGLGLDRGPDDEATRRGDLALSAARASVSLAPLLRRRVRLAVTDGLIERLDPASDAPTGQRVSAIDGNVTVPLPGWRPRVVVELLRQEAERILAEGRTDLDLSLAAVITVPLGGTTHELRLRSEPDGVGTRLSIDPDDVRSLARAYTTPLTEAEIELVAANPARAPRLLRLTQQAEQAAAALLSRDPGFPDDAYRHVYWSWLLTREFGAEFAERVTDAHEEGATYEFGEAQRRMDLINNALGREYAAADVPALGIPGRVLSDPRVIRSQADVLRVGGA